MVNLKNSNAVGKFWEIRVKSLHDKMPEQFDGEQQQ